MNRKLTILAVAALLSLCSAAQARFVQSGPVGYLDSVYLYTYVGNDPANNTDPSGKMCDGVGSM